LQVFCNRLLIMLSKIRGMTRAHTERTRKTERLGTVLGRIAAKLKATQRNKIAPTPEGAEAVSRTDADGPARPARAGGVTDWGVAQAKRTAFREYGAPGGMGAGCETPLVGVHPVHHFRVSPSLRSLSSAAR
jgi:hypothetical protein